MFRDPGCDDDLEDTTPDPDDHVPLGDVVEEAKRERWLTEVEEMAKALKAAEGAIAATDGPVEFMTLAQLCAMPDEPTPWAIRGIITKGALGVVGGEPKSTKTWAGIEMALAVASGRKCFGEFPSTIPPADVALFLAEDSPAATRARCVALMADMSERQRAEVMGRVHIKTLSPIDLLDDLAVTRLAASLARLQPAFVLLDPLVELHHANEDKAAEMAPVMRRLRALRTVLRTTVVFVHHAGKSSADSKGRRGGQRLRGSGSVHGAVDSGLYLSDLQGNLQDEFVCTAHAEVKGARAAGGFSLRLNIDDDARGMASTARWTVEDPQEARENKAKERVLGAMRAIIGDSDGRATTKEVRELARMKHQAVSDALASLAQDGLVMRGVKDGWSLSGAAKMHSGER